MELFNQAGVELSGTKWRWYLHGRHLALESGGWPVPRTRRVVYHFHDDCVAESEAEAKGKFESLHGASGKHNQWLKFWRGSELKDPAMKKKQSNQRKPTK